MSVYLTSITKGMTFCVQDEAQNSPVITGHALCFHFQIGDILGTASNIDIKYIPCTISCFALFCVNIPDSKVRVANMRPTWGLVARGGPHVGLKNIAIRDIMISYWFHVLYLPGAWITTIGWCLCCPPIRSQIWTFLLANADFNTERS